MEFARDAIYNFTYHYKEGNLNYPMIIYLVLVHVVAVVGLTKIPVCSPETLLWAFILWPIRYVSCVVVKSAESSRPLTYSLTVALVLLLVFTVCGRTEVTRQVCRSAFTLCSPTQLPTKAAFTTGLVITAFTISSVRLTLIPTTPCVAFSLLTWDGS